jgi:hypothetical protein
VTRPGVTRFCTFPDCQARAVAKGLCAKHTMRLRRHGDPAKVNRAGRKRGDRQIRELMSELSDRSYARYRRGLRLLRLFDLDVEPVIKACGRPNGSMNWALFERIAESQAAMALAEREMSEADRIASR